LVHPSVRGETIESRSTRRIADLDVSCNPMHTPAQLRDRLLELGIDRDLRTLTNWRQKGLLPQLQSISSGRGRGVKRYWSDEVLDQAIAADWLITICGRADETLLGLWLSGYSVDPAAARRAWIKHLKRVQHRRQKAASRYSGGFSGLGRSWWRRLQSDKVFGVPWWRELSSSDRESFSDLLGDTQEWMRDDINRDDEAYRNQISELIVRLTKADRKIVYEQIDGLWAVIDPTTSFAIAPFMAFVKSMSQRELKAAQKSVANVAHTLQHALQLGGLADRVACVIGPVRLMQDFFGPLVVRTLIMTNRAAPELPVGQALSTLCDFVNSVQSTDIIHKNDGGIVVSGRIRIEWEATKKRLGQL